MKNYYRVSEAASLLHMSASTLRKYTAQGLIECSRNLAGQRLYSPEVIKNFLDETNPPVAFQKGTALYISDPDGPRLGRTNKLNLHDAHGEDSRAVQDEFSDVTGSQDGQDGLGTLLNLARNRGIECITFNPQDNSYLEHLLDDYDVKIIVLDNGASHKENPLYG